MTPITGLDGASLSKTDVPKTARLRVPLSDSGISRQWRALRMRSGAMRVPVHTAGTS